MLAERVVAWISLRLSIDGTYLSCCKVQHRLGRVDGLVDQNRFTKLKLVTTSSLSATCLFELVLAIGFAHHAAAAASNHCYLHTHLCQSFQRHLSTSALQCGCDDQS
eukprot:2190607-Amphidinium_carterae.1